MDINTKCINFLKKDLSNSNNTKFQDPDFKHSKYIVDILPDINNNQVKKKIFYFSKICLV